MVYIFYHNKAGGSTEKIIDQLMNSFPSGIRSQLSRYRNQADRQRAILGKALLVRALEVLGIGHSLDEMKYTGYQRPYFNSSFDFNLSHSGDVVVCAISKTHLVGIDIEKIKAVVIDDFKSAFSEKDWQAIVDADAGERLHCFYSLWTKRESFLKAIGTGVHQSTNKITLNRNTISWDQKEWMLHEIVIQKEYCCHLAVDQFLPPLQLQEISFD